MINWDEFEHIHVIRKLKEILSNWWNIEVIFTDDRGNIRGFNREKQVFKNVGVRYILSKESGVNSLAELIKNSVEDLRRAENKFVLKQWNASGYDAVVFPIVLENEFMGSVVATGFFKDASSSARVREEVGI
jgi:hypothetical protein